MTAAGVVRPRGGRQTGGMASVAILVTGSTDSGTASLARTLAAVLGCPALSADPVRSALADQVGPMVPAERLEALADEAIWSTAAALEAGVVVTGDWTGDEAVGRVTEGLARAGSPRTVEVWCDARDGASAPLGAWPVVRADATGEADLDALVTEIGEHFS